MTRGAALISAMTASVTHAHEQIVGLTTTPLEHLQNTKPRATSRGFLFESRTLEWSAFRGKADIRNVRVDIRAGAGNLATTRKYAAELVALAPDVILGAGATPVASLLEATHTVPIVFAIVVDPMGAGFIEKLSRPGSNATGFMMFDYSLSGKWLELLKQVVPGVMQAAVLRDVCAVGGAIGGAFFLSPQLQLVLPETSPRFQKTGSPKVMRRVLVNATS